MCTDPEEAPKKKPEKKSSVISINEVNNLVEDGEEIELDDFDVDKDFYNGGEIL